MGVVGRFLQPTKPISRLLHDVRSYCVRVQVVRDISHVEATQERCFCRLPWPCCLFMIVLEQTRRLQQCSRQELRCPLLSTRTGLVFKPRGGAVSSLLWRVWMRVGNIH